MALNLTQERYKQALEISRKASFLKMNLVSSPDVPLRYGLYRIARPLLKLYYKYYKLIHPHTPWTSPASIAIFDKLLNKSMAGFEYGSGNSTKFFASKLGHLVSVEHNQEWHRIVEQQLQELGLTNVDYRFIAEGKPDKESEARAKELINHYKLQPGSFEPKPEFFDYYQFISTFPDNSFDFILVDGRARVECTLNAIPKLKSGGLMVLDNSERERYKVLHEVLKGWPKVNTTMGLTDTTIWFKP